MLTASFSALRWTVACEADPVSIAAGQAEVPDGGVLGDEADALGPEGADFGGEAAADQPGPASGQDHAAVDGEVRMGIGGEQGVVLGARGCPTRRGRWDMAPVPLVRMRWRSGSERICGPSASAVGSARGAGRRRWTVPRWQGRRRRTEAGPCRSGRAGDEAEVAAAGAGQAVAFG